MLEAWMKQFVEMLAVSLGTYEFVVSGILALILVCLLCGMVGAMVVGERMAFFSDAMAHCAFAGVSLGYLSVLLAGGTRADEAWAVPLVMVLLGIAAGVGMIYVQQRTGLAHDTVIGVFFALSIGLGAMLFQVLAQKSTFNPENFLFGNLIWIPELDLVYLVGLGLVVAPLFAWRYNQLVFGSFNRTLARTRGLNLTLNNYLFIIILALVVNLSIKAVGALLINAMLIVPAAAAANLARNLRQMFWLTVALSLGGGLLGYALSTNIDVTIGGGAPVRFGPSGLIVVTSVTLFFASIVVRKVWDRFAPIMGWTKLSRRPAHLHGPDDPCSHDRPFGQCP